MPEVSAPTNTADLADIAIIGTGAAGLFAAISAGRAAQHAAHPLRIVALDSARSLGAKILVAGGGRCNVTHHHVDESAYAGSSRNAIKKVLRAFTVEDTIEFFEHLDVHLKREDTGKLFPTTDSARTVLNALLRAAAEAHVEIIHPWRADRIEHDAQASHPFTIYPAQPTDPAASPLAPLRARALILATGGKSLPKSGSDGHGYTFARALAHSITPHIFPSLVPLVVDVNKTFVHELSGIALDAELTLRAPSGKKLLSFRNSLLFTHFGLSGPAALDISRYYTDARRADAGTQLTLNALPDHTFESLDALLAPSGAAAKLSIARTLTDAAHLPDRFIRALCASIALDPALPLHQLSRDNRRALLHALTALPLPIAGDRGFTYAEVTAGGVPLAELHLDSMHSRLTPNLYMCGEICDVDGRIGGFNFQWAWSSGHLAGTAAARALTQSPK